MYEKKNAYPMFWLNGNNVLALKLSLTQESSFDEEVIGCKKYEMKLKIL